MTRDLGHSERSDADADTEPPDSTTSGDPSAEDESRVNMVDRSENDEIRAEREAEFSWTGSEVYFPLLIGGLLLVSFPEPVTSFVGLVSIAIGLFLAVFELLSSTESVAQQ